MKANINTAAGRRRTNIYAWIQFYDDNGNYDERFIEDAKPEDMPRSVTESFETGHDITLYIAPGDMVGVFAKDPWDIINYVNYGCGGTEGLKRQLGEYTEDKMIMSTVTRLTKVFGRYVPAT